MPHIGVVMCVGYLRRAAYLIYLFSLVLLPLSIDGRIATVFKNASHKYVFFNPSKNSVLSTSGITREDDTIFVISV